MARLLWEHQGQVIKDYPFTKGSVMIGRHRDNTIVVSNREVSSSHARVDKIGPDYVLTDLQSTNGTFVNGLKVLSHRLVHGDRISIGKNVLLFIGTEKALVEAERTNIPLNATAIIGAKKPQKRPSIAAAKIEPHYIQPVPTHKYFRIFLVSFLVVGVLVVLGVFVVKNKPFFLRGILPKASQEHRTVGTAVAPSAEGEETSEQGDVSLPATSESQKSQLYVPGRPKGLWWKWKRDPFTVDAVLFYAQRGHGKRSSYYSDYTFGVWTAGEDGDELVPVGKAYFGFTDEELLQIDRFVRRNTTEKFGPVRHVVHEPDQGLVLEVAFEGLQRSPRHKSGVAMRFPRISRLRWDKPPREADRLETLERMLISMTGS